MRGPLRPGEGGEAVREAGARRCWAGEGWGAARRSREEEKAAWEERGEEEKWRGRRERWVPPSALRNC